ncbi:reverse transcriptase domain-containing protein [Tanacetum coccineum]
MEAAKEAFQAMKKLIADLPTLTAPIKDEELMVYLSTANEVVSAVLLVERNGRQPSIHYVSRSLQGSEVNYAPLEKLALALVHAAKPDTMAKDGPTNAIVAKTDKTSIEGEVLEVRRAAVDQVPTVPPYEVDTWKLYTDKASNNHESGAGLILIDPEGKHYTYAL